MTRDHVARTTGRLRRNRDLATTLLRRRQQKKDAASVISGASSASRFARSFTILALVLQEHVIDAARTRR